MGHGLDPRSAPWRSGAIRTSTGPLTLPTAAEGGSRPTTRRRTADELSDRAGGAVPEGRARSKEMVRGIGQAGSP